MKIITYINEAAENNKDFLALNKILSKFSGSELVLISTHLHAYTPSMSPIIGQGYNISGPSITEAERIQVENNLLSLKNRIGEDEVDVDIDVITYPFENYLKAPKHENVLFATILRESDSNFWNDLFGTEETNFANHSNLPLLIVPPEVKAVLPRKALFVINDTQKVERLDQLVEIANLFDIEVHYLINSDKYKASQSSYLSAIEYDLNIKFSAMKGKVSFYENDESQEIEKLIKIDQPDWIAYQNVFYHGLLSGGKNLHKNHIILNTDKPLLLI